MDLISNQSNEAGRQEQLRSEISVNQEAGLRIFNAVRERADTRIRGSRLSCPFVDPARIPAEDISGLKPGGKLTAEQARDEAVRGAAGVAIEATTQIVEARPTSQGVVEDGESVARLKQFVVKGGADLVANLLQGKDPRKTQLVQDAARAAMLRRVTDSNQRKSIEQMPGEKVDQWILQQFRTADGRLARTLDMIRQYRYGP